MYIYIYIFLTLASCSLASLSFIFNTISSKFVLLSGITYYINIKQTMMNYLIIYHNYYIK